MPALSEISVSSSKSALRALLIYTISSKITANIATIVKILSEIFIIRPHNSDVIGCVRNPTLTKLIKHDRLNTETGNSQALACKPAENSQTTWRTG